MVKAKIKASKKPNPAESQRRPRITNNVRTVVMALPTSRNTKISNAT